MKPIARRAIEYCVWLTHDKVLSCLGVLVFLVLIVFQLLSISVSGNVLWLSVVGIFVMFPVCQAIREIVMEHFKECDLRPAPGGFLVFWKYVLLAEALVLVLLIIISGVLPGV